MPLVIVDFACISFSKVDLKFTAEKIRSDLERETEFLQTYGNTLNDGLSKREREKLLDETLGRPFISRVKP